MYIKYYIQRLVNGAVRAILLGTTEVIFSETAQKWKTIQNNYFNTPSPCLLNHVNGQVINQARGDRQLALYGKYSQ